MSITASTTAAKGAAFAFAGGTMTILGEMANLSAEDWVLLLACIGACLLSGSMAAGAVFEAQNGHDMARVARERKKRAGIFAAQFMAGIIIAAQMHGSLWPTMAICLVVGWTGTQVLNWMAKRTGMGGVE